MISTNEQKQLKEITNLLHQHGFTGIKYYIKQERVKRINLFMGDIDEFVKSDETVYFVEGGKDNKRCCTYFNSLEKKQNILERMEESAKASRVEYKYKSVKGSKDFLEKEAIVESTDSIEHILKEAESAAYKYDEVFLVNGCEYRNYIENVTMLDEDENMVSDSSSYCSGRVDVISKREDDKSIAVGYDFGHSFKSIDMIKLSEDTSKRGMQALGGKAISSGIYKAVIENRVAAEILEAYLPIFYGDNVQDGISKVGKELGRSIGVKELNIYEDPLCKAGRCRRSIDDEGNPVKGKYIIREGVLESILYNNITAEKAGLVSTGNGFKNSITSDVGINVTNVIVEGTNGVPAVELFKNIDKGILITEVDGVFAGVNINNGDFSLLARGNIISDGIVKEPFCDVTISGNIYDLLKNIIGFGNDTICTTPYCASVISPSILIKSITVSGI